MEEPVDNDNSNTSHILSLGEEIFPVATQPRKRINAVQIVVGVVFSCLP